jgi:uncharacterized protein
MSADRVIYLDSSAIVKMVVREPESRALRRYLGRRRVVVSSALARTEVTRAVLPLGQDAVQKARDVLRHIDLIRVNDRVLTMAGALEPADLRALDAIHLATVALLGDSRPQCRLLRRTVVSDRPGTRLDGAVPELTRLVRAPRSYDRLPCRLDLGARVSPRSPLRRCHGDAGNAVRRASFDLLQMRSVTPSGAEAPRRTGNRAAFCVRARRLVKSAASFQSCS